MRLLIALLGLLLLLAACSDRERPVTEQSVPAVTILPDTPAITAEAAISPEPSATPEIPRLSACPGTPPIKLIVQERGQVIDDSESLNMRSGPGMIYNVLTRIESGEIFFVVGGPACADSYTWFQVRYDDLIGWIAEGDLEEYYVSPYFPG